MWELWAEYVVDNPQLFKTGDLKSAESIIADLMSGQHCDPAEGDHVHPVASLETK